MTPFSFQLTCCAKGLCNPLLKSWTKLRSRPIGVAESHVMMKRNDGLDLFASLKQWWLCIACQLWRHLFIASTAFQRKWNSRPAQWCRPWLPHDSWLPLLRFNDCNGKAFGWWYFRHLHRFMTWLAWQHNCRSCNKTAKRVNAIIPTWWGIIPTLAEPNDVVKF